MTALIYTLTLTKKSQLMTRILPKSILDLLMVTTMLLLFHPKVNSQNLYAPVTGPGVQAGTVLSNGGLCVTQLCLGSGYENLQRIIDGNLTTSATAASLANILNNGGVSVKNFNQVYPAGYVAGYLFSSESVLNIGVLNSMTVSTYKNGILQESKSAGALLGANIITSEMQKVYLTFITTKDFDEIRFRTTGLPVQVLNGISVFSAFAFPSNVTNNGAVVTNCDRPIGGIATAVSYDGPGVCALCTLLNPENMNDGNSNNYATLVTTASVLTSPSVGVLNTAAVYPAGYKAGFVVSPSNGTGLEYIALLNSITVETYLFGEKQETATTSTGTNGALLTLKLLTYNGTQRNKIGFTTTKPFNEVRFRQNPGANVVVGSLNMYYAYAEPGNCTDCKVYLGSQPTGRYSGAIVGNSLFTVNTGTYGIALHSLTNTANIVSPSTTDYATYTAPLLLDLLSGVKVTVKNDGTLFPAGTKAGFDIVQSGGIIDVSILNSIQIRTYKIVGGALQLVEQRLHNADLLGVDLIGGTSQRASIGFTTTLPFSVIQIDISGGLLNVNLGGKTQIYGAFVYEDADGDGYGDCQDVCAGGDDAIDSDNDGIPDACDVCRAGNVAPNVPGQFLTNDCNGAQPGIVTLQPAGSNVPFTTFEYHSALPATPANKVTSMTVSTPGQSLYYGVYFDAAQSCYSPSTMVTVNIVECTRPDLTPVIIFGDALVTGYDTLNIGFEIKNINSVPSTGPITVTISKSPQKTIFLPFNPARTSITVLNQGIPLNIAVNNSGWTAVDQGNYIVLTTSQVIAANSSSKIGFTIRQHPSNLNDDVISVHVEDNSGGEINTTNNTANIFIAYEYGNGPMNRPLSTQYDLSGDKNRNLEVYPNPTATSAHVSGLKGHEQITVVNIFGQVIMNLKADAPNVELDLQQFAAGTYSIIIIDKEGLKTTKKLIKTN